LSKYPILTSDYNEKGNFVKTTIDMGDNLLDVFNIHLEVPFFYFYGNFTERRKEQFNELLKNVVLKRTIIAGDFNTMTNHNFIKILKKNFLISNPVGFMSFPTTWPSFFPLIRIDFAFSSKDVKPIEYEKFCKPKLSDHCATIHTFGI